MARAAILRTNLADAGTISASSWIAAAPPSLLQNQHVARRWKGRNADSESLVLDFGAATSLDSLGVFGCQAITDDVQANMNATAVTRVRGSTVDATGAAGDAYDSGSAAGRISDAYGALVMFLSAPVTARYVRIDLSQASADAILAGRLVVGLREQFALNFGYGWSFGYADLSRLHKASGGQTFIDRDDRYRVLNCTFNSVSPAQRYGLVHDTDRVNGISRDILFTIDPESTDPARDTIWGLVRDLSPPTNPVYRRFAKQYAIEERL